MGEAYIIPAVPQIPSLDRYLSCILGGALGDALGYTAEADGWERIESENGEGGICFPLLDPVSGKQRGQQFKQGTARRPQLFSPDDAVISEMALYADARRTAGSKL